MKNFLNDYYELCKHSCKFCKDHWFGLIITNIVVAFGTTVYYARKFKLWNH